MSHSMGMKSCAVLAQLANLIRLRLVRLIQSLGYRMQPWQTAHAPSCGLRNQQSDSILTGHGAL